MDIEMSRQKHLIRRHHRSYSMIGYTLYDSGNLIDGRTLDRRFLPGIDTRRWETINKNNYSLIIVAPVWVRVPVTPHDFKFVSREAVSYKAEI
jgi:hypothetical protein